MTVYNKGKCLSVIFLTIHALLPLDYYLLRKDVLDERFAWRMFSSVTSSRKIVRFYGIFHQSEMPMEDGKKLELLKHADYFPKDWSTVIKIGHSEVARKAALYLCKATNNTFDYVRVKIAVDWFNGSRTFPLRGENIACIPPFSQGK